MYTKEINQKTIQVMGVNKFSIIIMLLSSLCCFSQDVITQFHSVQVYDHKEYYKNIESTFDLKDFIEIGYMGQNDSIDILINDKLIFSGRTKYSAKIGSGELLSKLKRESIDSLECEIVFFDRKVCIALNLENLYNSILLQNNLNYSEELGKYKEDVRFFLYQESGRFH